MAGYNVTKAAVVALSETLRSECLGSGIQVTVACPCFSKAAFFKSRAMTRPEFREVAQKFFDGSFSTASGVAQDCLARR